MTFHYRPWLYFLRQAECVFHWFSWIGCPESLRDLPVFPSQHWAYRHMREGTHQAFHMSAGDPDAGQAGTANSLWVNSLAPRLHWFMHFPARGGSWLEPSYTGHRSTGASLELIYILASSHMGGRFWGSKLPGCFQAFITSGIHCHYITSQVVELGDVSLNPGPLRGDEWEAFTLSCNTTPIKPYCKGGKKQGERIKKLRSQSSESALGKAADGREVHGVEHFTELKGFTDMILGNLRKNQIVQSKLKPFLILRKLVSEKVAQERNTYLLVDMLQMNQRRKETWETRQRRLQSPWSSVNGISTDCGEGWGHPWNGKTPSAAKEQ